MEVWHRGEQLRGCCCTIWNTDLGVGMTNSYEEEEESGMTPRFLVLKTRCMVVPRATKLRKYRKNSLMD